MSSHTCYDHLIYTEGMVQDETGTYWEAQYVCQVCDRHFDITDVNAELATTEKAPP